jgi:hypothetical protein
MITPALALRRFLLALPLGAALGLCYDFLRPLRPRHTALSDLLFLPILFWVWLYHSFAICRGDLRLGYSAGLLLGGIVWELTAGRLLRPVFFGFWRFWSRLTAFFLTPVRKFFKKTAKSIKFLLATAKKAVTIKCKSRLRERKPK